MAGAEGMMGMTSILPKSLSNSSGTISLLAAFPPDALVIPVTACLATDTVAPGITTLSFSLLDPDLGTSVACLQQVTAIADKQAARSSRVNGAGRPLPVYEVGGGAVPVAAAVLARIEATAPRLGGESTSFVATAYSSDESTRVRSAVCGRIDVESPVLSSISCESSAVMAAGWSIGATRDDQLSLLS